MNFLCKTCYQPITNGQSNCQNCGAEIITETAPLADLLATCPVCSAPVSRMAQACPNCGHPISPSDDSRTVQIEGLKISLNQVVDLTVKLFLASLPIAILLWFVLWLLTY